MLAGETPKNLNLAPNKPCIPIAEGSRVLSRDQVQAIANREVQCKKFESDLKLTQDAYQKLLNQSPPSEGFMSGPTWAVGGFVVGVGVGAILVALIKK